MVHLPSACYQACQPTNVLELIYPHEYSKPVGTTIAMPEEEGKSINRKDLAYQREFFIPVQCLRSACSPKFD